MPPRPPAADAIGFAEELGHHPSGIGALGEGMAMATMGGGDPVGAPEVSADTDASGLLADIEMEKARGLALAAGDLRDALEASEQNHLLEQAQQHGTIGQIGRTRWLRAAACQGSCHPDPPSFEAGSGRAVMLSASMRENRL